MKRMAPLLLFVVACSETVAPTDTAVSQTATVAPDTTLTTTASETAPATVTEPEPEAIPTVMGPKLLPVDQASQDPALVDYRRDLLEEVRSRNIEAVAARVDRNIRTTFGSGGGLKDFRRILGEPGVWEQLERALELGGTFVGEGETRAFWTPYVYSAWPDRHDAFESLVVIGEDVPLRETPEEGGRIVATMTHDIVQRVNPGSDLEESFVHIKTADGRTGFVATSSVWSPVGYRAGFNLVDGEWKMTGFVAGD